MNIQVITLTVDQQEELISRAVKKALVEIEESRKSQDRDKREDLQTLLERDFPRYHTDYWIYKLKKAIKAGEVGKIDRYNSYTASFNELNKFLYGK